MARYTLSDVVQIRLTPAGHDRWTYFTVVNVMTDGTTKRAPAVNTVKQAEQRQRDFFPNATVTIESR